MRHKEIHPIKGNAFQGCKLDREKYANVLTNIISTYSEGFVLAINNKWGTGKTTFVRMWEQQLKDNEYTTIYFNAWENDFEDNPLAAILGELKILTKAKEEKQFKEILERAASITKTVAPQIIAGFIMKQAGMGDYKDFAENASKGLLEMFHKDVEQYASKKKSIKDLREKLEIFLSKITSGKPLIFIVDELDRCRPNYAVSVLEQIKHFFSVKGIVFVLSIDKEQLSNAVKGVYGTESIDAEGYLRRFIDLEYSIPEPEKNLFCLYLYEYFRFDDCFNRFGTKNYKKEFNEIAYLLLNKSSISLRQQEKVLGHCRITLRSFSDEEKIFPGLLLF